MNAAHAVNAEDVPTLDDIHDGITCSKGLTETILVALNSGDKCDVFGALAILIGYLDGLLDSVDALASEQRLAAQWAAEEQAKQPRARKRDKGA